MIEKEGGREAAEGAGDAKEMRAVVLSAFGGLNKLRVSEKAMPEPQEGELKIRVKAWSSIAPRPVLPGAAGGCGTPRAGRGARSGPDQPRSPRLWRRLPSPVASPRGSPAPGSRRRPVPSPAQLRAPGRAAGFVCAPGQENCPRRLTRPAGGKGGESLARCVQGLGFCEKCACQIVRVAQHPSLSLLTLAVVFLLAITYLSQHPFSIGAAVAAWPELGITSQY